MIVHVYVYENTETTLWFESLVVCEGGPWQLIREYDKEIPDPVGPGGTTDYNQLQNRPYINSVLLSGNKTSRELQVSEIRINDSTGYMDITDSVKSASLNVNGDGDLEVMLVEPGTYLKTATVPSKTNVETALAEKQDKHVYVVDKPEGSSPVSGNVVQVGDFVNRDGKKYGIFEFYYRTNALPAADTTKTFPLTPLLDDYTILDFVDATGVTGNGHFIGSGRTDGTNRIIVQQFSKNNKTFTMRAYGDYSQETALVKIKFIGTKNA